MQVLEFFTSRVRINNVVNESATRALTALGQPHSGQDGAVVRSPNPVHEQTLVAQGHVARRRSANQTWRLSHYYTFLPEKFANLPSRAEKSCVVFGAEQPSIPKVPACASISDVPTLTPGVSPNWVAAAGVKWPARLPGIRTSVPICSFFKSPRPICSKKSRAQNPFPSASTWYVHLHTNEHNDLGNRKLFVYIDH
jgi:hypothetical protein